MERLQPYKLAAQDVADNFRFGFDYSKPMQGMEYCTRVKLKAPDGSISHGAAHVEHVIVGAYKPYGFTENA